MGVSRMKTEWVARLLVFFLIVSVPTVALAARFVNQSGVVEVHAAMPEQGGWLPDTITARAGEPLHLRLISDDVVHGFAIGQSDLAPVDVLPGKPVDLTLAFDQPGTYTFYCTRWCGPNHWRMRGTITVEGSDHSPLVKDTSSPLYLNLGIDLDAPHEVEVSLERTPSATRGAGLGVDLPSEYQTREYYLSHSPYDAWQDLRDLHEKDDLSDVDIWDQVSWIWASNTTTEILKQGEQLYTQNCAACHGVDGKGDGVFAITSENGISNELDQTMTGHEVVEPTDFTDAEHMLAASQALFQGKIMRGGMGTGMPSWGLIFTDEQTWSLVDYLWTFQFIYEE
jgi:cytochrome c oxidase subunit 2